MVNWLGEVEVQPVCDVDERRRWDARVARAPACSARTYKSRGRPLCRPELCPIRSQPAAR